MTNAKNSAKSKAARVGDERSEAPGGASRPLGGLDLSVERVRATLESELVSVARAAAILRLGRGRVASLVQSGELKGKKVGARMKISMASILDFANGK